MTESNRQLNTARRRVPEPKSSSTKVFQSISPATSTGEPFEGDAAVELQAQETHEMSVFGQ
jgi:hypothetical protein